MHSIYFSLNLFVHQWQSIPTFSDTYLNFFIELLEMFPYYFLSANALWEEQGVSASAGAQMGPYPGCCVCVALHACPSCFTGDGNFFTIKLEQWKLSR